MPFPFGAVCDLLQSLENDPKRPARAKKGSTQIVHEWFDRHEELLDQTDVDKVALLSTLLPERRTDRVFSIKEPRLERIVAKACLLGDRKKHLQRWKTDPGSGVDLADCVEAVFAETPNGSGEEITVEKIDETLHELAAGVAFSSPAVRSSRRTTKSTPGHDSHPLESFFRRFTPRDAKWMCRLILKSFYPVIVPEYLVYSRCHPLLPTVMKIHDNFAVATRLLDRHHRNSQLLDVDLDKADLTRLIKPQVGVKVGRQTWLKARSIMHALDLGRGLMSCETKMDGEYCQIHIDLAKGRDCIQIFSKSGKDSTTDRIKLHDAIRTSLGLGTSSCGFERRCILEGEMVVWSEAEKKILGFEKIRKHVNRSGRYIGTDEDSQPHSWEKLMVVYFDLLLVDDESLLNVRHSERRRRLSRLVHCQEGRADLVKSQIINFTSRKVAAKELRNAFASCISMREEGLVLRPDEPYFDFGPTKRRYASCCLKLKKGYIKGLGDVGDFAVVGARYDPTRAKGLGLPNTNYTHFYLGCLTNKEAVTRFGEKPKFMMVNEVEMNKEMTEFFRRFVWARAVAPEDNGEFDVEAPLGVLQGKKMTVVFLERPVVDVTCFSFHKEANTGFWSLRFPYVSKIHLDRSWEDCIGFEELQELAEADTGHPDEEDSQEMAQWIKALEDVGPKRTRKTIAAERQATDSTLSTTSIEETDTQRGVTKLLTKPRTDRADEEASAGTGIITPPTSSAAQPPDAASPRRSRSSKSSPARKRPRESSPASSRKDKRRREVIDLTASSVPEPCSQGSVRAPLEDITSAAASQGNILPSPVPRPTRGRKFYEESSAVKPDPLPRYLPASASCNSAAVISSLSGVQTRAPPTATTAISGTWPSPSCRHAGGACALANRFVLLSPCVATIPWLTEDLLPGHGVAMVFTDIASWLASTSLQSTAASSRRHPRVVLVERRRTEATRNFLAKVQANPLVGRSGRSEQVIAYDWRLVEAITDEEKTQRKSHGSGGTQRRKGTGAHAQELWRKYYVGLC